MEEASDSPEQLSQAMLRSFGDAIRAATDHINRLRSSASLMRAHRMRDSERSELQLLSNDAQAAVRKMIDIDCSLKQFEARNPTISARARLSYRKLFAEMRVLISQLNDVNADVVLLLNARRCAPSVSAASSPASVERSGRGSAACGPSTVCVELDDSETVRNVHRSIKSTSSMAEELSRLISQHDGHIDKIESDSLQNRIVTFNAVRELRTAYSRKYSKLRRFAIVLVLLFCLLFYASYSRPRPVLVTDMPQQGNPANTP